MERRRCRLSGPGPGRAGISFRLARPALQIFLARAQSEAAKPRPRGTACESSFGHWDHQAIWAARAAPFKAKAGRKKNGPHVDHFAMVSKQRLSDARLMVRTSQHLFDKIGLVEDGARVGECPSFNVWKL